MLPTPVEIKEKLLQALDDRNDVDDATVVEMVTILEKYPVTRATLEETRIGKMVNDLRRKIKNEKLAKRVKQLVKNWKQLLDQKTPINGSPGPLHPALPQLHASPAVSPAMARPAGPGRLVSPAHVAGRSARMGLGAPLSSSPALLDKGPGQKGISPVLGHKRFSPAAGPARPSGSSASSPAFSRAHSSVVSSRGVSPALSSQAVSPAITRPTQSPAVSATVLSPASVSRAVSKARPSSSASPPVHSPALQSTLVAGGKPDEWSKGKQRRKGRRPVGGEGSGCGGQVTTSSLHSDNSQDRLMWERDNGKPDSDSESCSSNRTGHAAPGYPHNHSNDVSLTKSKTKHRGKDQRELSKTNAANRKRTRSKLDSPPENGVQSRLESTASCHRAGEKVNNGCVSKYRKKTMLGMDLARPTSASSLGSVPKPVHSPTASIEEPVSGPDGLFRQESTDSLFKHKVKTTEQLIEDLQKINKSTVPNSIITKLNTNQIEREPDVQESVLPASMKKRGKRGRRGKNDIHISVPASDLTLSQAKSELVERFLKTSDPSSTVEEDSPFREDLRPKLGMASCTASFTKEHLDTSFSASRQDRSESAPKDDNSMDAISPPSASQPARTGSALTLEEIYAQLPPIDYDIDWDAVDFYQVPEPAPPLDAETEPGPQHRPGVDGVYGMNRTWTNWQDCVTQLSYEGNMLHILPYVDLDQ